jgi:hypothetical protein
MLSEEKEDERKKEGLFEEGLSRGAVVERSREEQLLRKLLNCSSGNAELLLRKQSAQLLLRKQIPESQRNLLN